MTGDYYTTRRMCSRCGIAVAKPTGLWCHLCYTTGEAGNADASAVAAHLRRLQSAGWTLREIADDTGCSWRALSEIARGRTRLTRRWIADAVAALDTDTDDDGCRTCDNIDVALFASSDPQAIADRLGSTAVALARHAYRCGRPDLGRLFSKPSTKSRYHDERTSA